jgi:hypothetical protein
MPFDSIHETDSGDQELFRLKTYALHRTKYALDG